jgi:hypothetical protein
MDRTRGLGSSLALLADGMTIDEFRKALREVEPFEVVDRYLLEGCPIHVPPEGNCLIRTELGERYGIRADNINCFIVGSAKLGFSLVEKKLRDGTTLPRYRKFSEQSDIDVAIVSSSVFEQIWFEISGYAHQSKPWPWKSGKLGDYLVSGWFRPDHFPVGQPRCNDWWDCFNRLSANAVFRRKVRGGLFYSVEHLRQYQLRSVRDCLNAEELSR